jgi:alkylhydroperoxidase/carboxymuconolactone decarboxylase family protein YurZ
MIEQVTNINKKFNEFTEEVFESEILSEKEKALVALATVTAFEDEDGVKNAIINAKQAMLSNEEIGYVMSLVIAMKGKKISKLGSKNSCNNNNEVRCC